MSRIFMKDLSELLRLAIAAYGAEIAELQEIRAQLLQLIEETPARSDIETGAPQKRGGLSAEARAKISAAQKARWASDRKEKAVEPGAPQKRGPLSAEARAKISAAQKVRGGVPGDFLRIVTIRPLAVQSEGFTNCISGTDLNPRASPAEIRKLEVLSFQCDEIGVTPRPLGNNP